MEQRVQPVAEEQRGRPSRSPPCRSPPLQACPLREPRAASFVTPHPWLVKGGART